MICEGRPKQLLVLDANRRGRNIKAASLSNSEKRTRNSLDGDHLLGTTSFIFGKGSPPAKNIGVQVLRRRRIKSTSEGRFENGGWTQKFRPSPSKDLVTGVTKLDGEVQRL